MATLTGGTNATTSLTALLATPTPNAADFATMSQSIKSDRIDGPVGKSTALVGGGWARPGLLIIPNRGVLEVLPGDYVMVDSTGWPILVSALAIASGPWTHS